ncbi:MAG: hypothetical protein ACFCUG_15065, partial [Thiotrichales bacterium]
RLPDPSLIGIGTHFVGWADEGSPTYMYDATTHSGYRLQKPEGIRKSEVVDFAMHRYSMSDFDPAPTESTRPPPQSGVAIGGGCDSRRRDAFALTRCPCNDLLHFVDGVRAQGL